MKTTISLLAACILSCSALAQDQTAVPAANPAANPDTSIHLNVVVTPHNGKPVAEIPESAFSVLDNGRPEPITNFRAVTGADAKVSVILAIDAVNLPYVQLAYERNQIESFLKSNDGQLSQPTALAVVTDTGTEMTPFGTNGAQLSQTLNQKTIGLRDLRRSSGFYGAEERLDVSLKAFQMLLQRGESVPGRKVLLWVSPGWPLLSGPAIQLTAKQEDNLYRQVASLTNAIRRTNTTVYSVDPIGSQQGVGREFYYENFLKGVKKPSQVLPGNLGLQVMAIQSGGEALSGSNDIAGEIRQVFDQTHAFYELNYQPPPADAPQEFHKIDVKLAQPGLTPHTTQGYYSQP